MGLQAFTIQALISHAIKENMTCPISMNPIEQRTACVTSCQHIFDRASIQRWLQDNTTCPVCRQDASVCV
jgi:SUMO ligase MMS21 Smc5/6 complex component